MRANGRRACQPALDQVPMDGRQRYLCQLQRLMIRCPDSEPVRRKYYEVLAGPIPPDKRLDLHRVIAAQVDNVTSFSNRWNIRLARKVRRFAIWLELAW